jgi:hypothetical protein
VRHSADAASGHGTESRTAFHGGVLSVAARSGSTELAAPMAGPAAALEAVGANAGCALAERCGPRLRRTRVTSRTSGRLVIVWDAAIKFTMSGSSVARSNFCLGALANSSAFLESKWIVPGLNSLKVDT